MLDFPNLTLLLQRCRPAGADAWGNSVTGLLRSENPLGLMLVPTTIVITGHNAVQIASQNLLGLCFHALLFLCVRSLWKTHRKIEKYLKTQHEIDRNCPSFSVLNFTRYMTVRQALF